jgi:class 3 adenylate cyclase
VILRRTGARFVDALALGSPGNGIIVSLFGLVTLVLHVDLSAGEVATLGAVWAAAFLIEGLAGGVHVRRAGRPVAEWLRGEGEAQAASAAAARLPLVVLRRPDLYLLGAAGAIGTGLVLAALLDLPARDAVLLFPFAFGLYVSSTILRYIALELSMRPLLERMETAAPLPFPRVTLHQRLFVTIPMVTWGASVVVAGLLTGNARDLDAIALAAVVAFAVTAGVSTWLSLVLADAVSAPIVDLRDATRRVGEGDLSTRVPVVCTDETGELAASFNAMVAGLQERERLHEAFGTFVDPSLTERVLAEGTDLRGEEVEASILFLDVREFTAFAEGAGPHEAVAALNALYETAVPSIVRHGGGAIKFIGDGLMAVFVHDGHAGRAVAAAREIGGAHGALRIGVGVNSGRVVVGTIGGGRRRDFTVIGDAVNTAARVEAATRVTGDDLLITDATLRALGAGAHGFEERPAVQLKGKTAGVRLYAPR